MKKFLTTFVLCLLVSIMFAADGKFLIPYDSDNGKFADNIDWVGAHYAVISSMTIGSAFVESVSNVPALIYGVGFSSSAETSNFITIYDSTDVANDTASNFIFDVTIDTNSAGAALQGGRFVKFPVPVQTDTGCRVVIGDGEQDWKATILYRKMRE